MRRSISILLLVVALQPAAVFAEKKKKRFWMNMQTGTVTAEDADPRSVMLHTGPLDSIAYYNFIGQAAVIFVGEIVKVTFDKKRNVQVVRFKPKKIWRGPKKEFLELEAGPPGDWCAKGLRAGVKLSVIGIGSPPLLELRIEDGRRRGIY